MTIAPSILQKIDAELHAAIDNDQILLTQLELIRPLLLQNSDREVTLALNKIEMLVFDQGKLLFNIRKHFQSAAENTSVFGKMMEALPKKQSR